MNASANFNFRERGRQAMIGAFCRVYFEVVSAPVPVTNLDIYGLDDAGHVLGHGTVHRMAGLQPGMLFELLLSLRADQVAKWQIQGGSFDALSKCVCTVEPLTSEEIAYQGESVRYIEPSPSVVAATNVMPRLRNNWTGIVIGSNRSNYYHHPDCRRARALNPGSRHEYSEPRQAWEAGLQPCFDCL